MWWRNGNFQKCEIRFLENLKNHSFTMFTWKEIRKSVDKWSTRVFVPGAVLCEKKTTSKSRRFLLRRADTIDFAGLREEYMAKGVCGARWQRRVSVLEKLQAISTSSYSTANETAALFASDSPISRVIKSMLRLGVCCSHIIRRVWHLSRDRWDNDIVNYLCDEYSKNCNYRDSCNNQRQDRLIFRVK